MKQFTWKKQGDTEFIDLNLAGNALIRIIKADNGIVVAGAINGDGFNILYDVEEYEKDNV
jgi:hypothetical protein